MTPEGHRLRLSQKKNILSYKYVEGVKYRQEAVNKGLSKSISTNKLLTGAIVLESGIKTKKRVKKGVIMDPRLMKKTFQ